MTFEEKLDRVITLLECLLEDKARNVGFTHVHTTQDVPSDIESMVTKDLPEKEQPETQASKFTHDDIRSIVADKKNKGVSAQDLKELLNKFGYTKIADIADKDIDSVYNAYVGL